MFLMIYHSMQESNLLDMKMCPKCQENKSLSEYGLSFYCKKCNANAVSDWRKENKIRDSKHAKAWYERNKSHKTTYMREKLKNRPLERMKHNLRTRLRSALKGAKKSKSLFFILGASIESVKSHLESKFVSGMTWENYGEWHVDHLVPLSSAQNTEQLIALCHYGNLQPLWASDNLKKSDKMPKNLRLGE